MVGHEAYQLVPLVVPLTSIAAANDIAVVLVKQDATINSISMSLRTLTSGTLTLVVKNDAAQMITSIAVTSAGSATGTLSITSISANDKFHFNLTGIGVGALDLTATVWLKMASTS